MSSLRNNGRRRWPFWRRVLCGAFIVSVSLSLAPRLHAETQAKYIDRLLATCASFDAEVKNQFAIARLDLDAVREADGWQPGQKEAAQAWLDGLERTGVYTTVETPTGPNSVTVHYRGIAPHHLQPPASRWGDAVTERLRNLEDVRRGLVSELSKALFDFADPIWLAAKTPADLQPAIEPLTRFKTDVLSKLPDITFNKSNAPFPNPSFTSNGTRIVLEGENVRGLALFILSPEPLIFPDPASDPAEYIRLRLLWADIGVWNLNGVSVSRMTHKLYDYDRRLKRAAQQTRRNLDQLILHAASPAELSKALADLEVFRIAEPPPPTPGRPLPFATPNPSRPQLTQSGRGKTPASENPIHDYRDLQKFSPTVSNNGSPYIQKLYPVIDGPVLDEYRAVVSLITAKASPAPPDLAPLRKAVSLRLRTLQPQMQAAVLPLLQPEAMKHTPLVARPQVDPADPPMTALVKLLETVSQAKNVLASSAATALLGAWQTQEPLLASRPQELPGGYSESWGQLATRPEGPIIFATRDRASRQLIQKITRATSDAAPPVLMREQLDKAIAAANWDLYRRLLAIDQLMTLLPTDEHAEWASLLEAFEAANTAAAQKQTANAQTMYRRILAHTYSTAAGQVAARLLKALPLPQEAQK